MDSEDSDYVLFTEAELRKLHRSFGHPSCTALSNLLKKARPEEYSSETRDALADIAESCNPSQRYATRPRRFKFTISTEELRFNHVVVAEVMYINHLSILHVVDEETHFMSARFLSNMKTGRVWKALQRCWIDVYLVPPDFLRIDQGLNLISKEFHAIATSHDTSVIEEPVESPSSMSHVERYYEPLQAAYNKLRSELDSTEFNDDVLGMAVKAVNDTVGPEGLCSTLLVFGALPRTARNMPSPNQVALAKAVENACKAVEKEHSKRKVQFSFRYCGKYGREREDLMSLTNGSDVLVNRERKEMARTL